MADETIEQIIGKAIRSCRTLQDITIEQLSQMVALTKGQISKIENGLVSSPVGTLTRIAQALGTDPSAFFRTTQSRKSAQLVHRHERKPVVGRASKIGHYYQSLAFDLPFQKPFEPYLMIIEEKKLDPKKNSFQHAGHEMLFMLKGQMTYRHDGTLYELEVGDTFYFDATKEHGPEQIKTSPVHFLSIISNQTLPIS